MISGQHLIVALWRLRKTWEKHTIPTPESNLYVRGINDAIKVIQQFNAKALEKVFFKKPELAQARIAMLDTLKFIDSKDYQEAKRRLRNHLALLYTDRGTSYAIAKRHRQGVLRENAAPIPHRQTTPPRTLKGKV